MYNNDKEAENLCCPITLEIYLDPVVASDGHVYEREAIMRCMRSRSISPITREVLNKELYPCYKIKSQVDEYLKLNPDKIHNQYVLSKKFDDAVLTITKAINDEKYDDLLNYVDYELEKLLNIINDMNEMGRENFFDKNNDDVIKYIIDNSINLNTMQAGLNNCLIHYVCQYASLNVIKYIISKNVNIEAENSKKVRPIHIACQFRDLDVVTAIVSNNININLNLEVADIEGWRPIHYASHFSSQLVIKYLISLGVELDAKTNDGYKCIHFICRNSTINMIQFIIYDNNYQLDMFDQQRCIRLIQLNENFSQSDKANAIDIIRKRKCNIM